MCLIRKAVIVSYLHTSEHLPEIQHPCCGETVASIPFNSNEESVHQQFATTMHIRFNLSILTGVSYRDTHFNLV